MERQRPKKVDLALKILYACTLVSAAISIAAFTVEFPSVYTHSAGSIVATAIFAVLSAVIFGLMIANIWLIGRRKNWARWVFLILLILGTFSTLKSIVADFLNSPFLNVLGWVITILDFVAVVFLFQKESDEWFKKTVATKTD